MKFTIRYTSIYLLERGALMVVCDILIKKQNQCVLFRYKKVCTIASSGSTKKDKNAAESCVLCEILHLKDERAVTTLRHFL